MEQEFSFGVVPVRFFQGLVQCFLVKLRSGNHWGFPKGHPEANETVQESAFRELEEETNLHVVKILSEEPFLEKYQPIRDGKATDKLVHYYLAEVDGIVQLQGEEILDGGWFSLDEALEKITYDPSKNVCRQVIDFFQSKK